MCAEHSRESMSDWVEQSLQASVGERPTVTEREHQSLMAAVRRGNRPVAFSSSFETRLKIAAGLTICGLLSAFFLT